MPVREFEFFHGAALARLISIAKNLQVERLNEIGAGCYLFNQTIGSMIKYATDRMTPWGFTFKAEHKRMLVDMHERYDEVLILLVCKDDGIVALDYESLVELIGTNDNVAGVSVSRKPRGMYLVSGPLGALDRKVADSDYAKTLLGPP